VRHWTWSRLDSIGKEEFASKLKFMNKSVDPFSWQKSQGWFDKKRRGQTHIS
jgi:hypothetical protein